MREEDHAMTPDQFIDAVADASNNPTPEKLERVRCGVGRGDFPSTPPARWGGRS
jgi:hypothetical protein